MIQSLHEESIENGLYMADFWGMTLGEILDFIKAYKAKIKREQKEKAILSYTAGILIGYAVNNPKEYPEISKAYPELFEEEQNKQQDWRVMKERIKEYSEIKKLSK